MKTYFITAPGTEIGKTHFLAQLLAYDQSAKKKFEALKPIISGWNDQKIDESDTGQLLAAMNRPLLEKQIEQISPWRYEPAVAPDLAQRMLAQSFDFEQLVSFCEIKAKDAHGLQKSLCIEGVGGLMSPICQDKTVLDWIMALQTEVLLVTSHYLGAISHTLTCLEVLKQKKITVKAIILNEAANSVVSSQQTITSLRNFTDCPIYIHPYQLGRFGPQVIELYEKLC